LPCWYADRQDMTKLIGAFRDWANVPRNKDAESVWTGFALTQWRAVVTTALNLLVP
jgi:hypothetical protein